ncbi:hypothetical protein L6164_033146 [Bauhinia variegata]|uniref:Uncharacterized protein n=1 Tax=Bauhinia variegata TaxID=167791 RepID=A0ACB9KRB2_BAUVA|nr:hypothetical protein L6164_033146 [Bauhinia variegata]
MQVVCTRRRNIKSLEPIWLDDKELNQYISMKKLAPYRDEEWKLSNLKRCQLKKRVREILHAGSLHKKKEHKKSRDDAGNSTLSNGEVDNEKKAHEKESNVDAGNLSRKAKRKQRRADLRLSHSRLLAYRKRESKSKGGRNH